MGEGITTPHLRRRMLELVHRFTSGNPSALVMKGKMTKLNLDSAAAERLKQLCNAIETDARNSALQSSRDMLHIYTNVLACIVSTSKDKTSHISFKEFKDKGWNFGRHRYQTARKRQQEGSFCEVRPAKRGRNPISLELIKKIENE